MANALYDNAREAFLKGDIDSSKFTTVDMGRGTYLTQSELYARWHAQIAAKMAGDGERVLSVPGLDEIWSPAYSPTVWEIESGVLRLKEVLR